ncbi:Ankyrin repeat [Olea europaea subsp. europaea]|uniref:Ankyrin repeat n=1 Tax=Olea europaea subsp. europaea TaxID=158383 RepID=A0A8S0R444_OLEEU|nr:Ankyrin repeat [Olea europaea subsp. europaea]
MGNGDGGAIGGGRMRKGGHGGGRVEEEDEWCLQKVISLQGMTALHVAASGSQSEFMEKLADLMPTAALNARDKRGCFALHYAAVGATVDAATALVEKNRALPLTTDIDGKTPLFFAANWGVRKEMLWNLSTVTTDEHPSYAFTGPCSSSLILGIAVAGFYDNEQTLHFFLDGGILHVATARGVVEIVEVTLNYVPDLLWYKYNNHTLLQVAIKHRREKLFNLRIDATARNTFLASGLDNDSNNTLHMVAKLAPFPQLNVVTGPAFQMQRELQWFKFGALWKQIQSRAEKWKRRNFSVGGSVVFPSFSAAVG